MLLATDGTAERKKELPFLESKAGINMPEKYYVYILRSVNSPEKVYVGCTEDLSRRIMEHNSESQIYSRRYAPWEIETYIVFSDKAAAFDFEKYLKSSSGKAFISKHLLNKFEF
jgi:predicted GIY-YIG superfamily endonuclease